MNGTTGTQDGEKKTLWLTPEYVDCECDDNYIKAVPEAGYGDDDVACGECGSLYSEQPDSRVEEVDAAGLPFDRERIEYAGMA